MNNTSMFCIIQTFKHGTHTGRQVDGAGPSADASRPAAGESSAEGA